MPPLPLLWLGLGALLLSLVLIGIDSDGLLLVGGLAALVGVAYALVRRWSSRHGERAIPPAARADLAEVIAPFDLEGEGRVRWQGQSWAARNLEPSRLLPSGSAVTVMGREGTRLQVLPRDPA